MKELQKRPLAIACLCFLLSLGAFLSLCPAEGGWVGGLLFWVAAIGVIASLLLRRRLLIPLCLILPLALGTLLAYVTAALPMARLEEAMGEEKVLVEGRCVEVLGKGQSFASVRLTVEKVGDDPLRCEAILQCHYEADLRRGDRIAVWAVLARDRADTDAFLGFADATLPLLLSQEQGLTFLSTGRNGPMEKLSTALSRRMDRMMGEEASALYRALILGKRENPGDEVTLIFRNLGISHVLAVSGLHLTLLLGGIEWLMKRLTVPARLRDILAMALTVFYVMLTGAPPSMLRAGGMLILTRLGGMAEREQDPFTNLAVALSVISLCSPRSVLDVGLLLSAFACAGLLLVTSLQGRERSGSGGLIQTLLLSAGALIATLPLVTGVYGGFSLMTLPANLLLTLPVALCLGCGVAFLLLGFLPLIGDAVAVLSEGAAILLLRSAEWLEGGAQHLALPSLPTLLAAFGLGVLALILLSLRSRTKRLRVLCVVVSMAVLGGGVMVERGLRTSRRAVTFFSQDGDDGFLIACGNEVVLCDLSDGSALPALMGYRLAEEQMGEAVVDGILLTHYHKRTLSTLSRMLSRGRLARLYLPIPQGDDEADLCRRLTLLGERWGCEVIYYDSDGGALPIGDLTLTVYKDVISCSTHPTLRLQIDRNGRRLGYLGASARESMEAEELRRWLSGCDQLILGAHGPKIKQTLPDCGEVVCADASVAEALGLPDATVLNGWEDPYTVIWKEE